MGQILKFPVQASKFGFQRARKKRKAGENPDQLPLFPEPRAQIIHFVSGTSSFEQALLCDECNDGRAADLYREAIQEGSCVADAYCNLGIIESKSGNTSKAFDCFTIALKHEPRHFEAHYNLGNLYFDVNDYRLAQVHYEMAIEVDPTFPNLYFNLALVRALTNNLASAAEALCRYQALVPKEEARHADELLQILRKSLDATGNSLRGS